MKPAVLYFDVVVEAYNIEEDLADVERAASCRDLGFTGDPNEDVNILLKLERQFMKEIAKAIGLPVYDEGHHDDDLVCKLVLSSLEEVQTVYDFISRNTTGGDDCVTLNTPYMTARGWTLYPDREMTNGKRYGMGAYTYTDGTIEEWLEMQVSL